MERIDNQISRFNKIRDAFSQLLNVTFLPCHDQTNANESISGRCYRQGWTRAEKWINWLFSPWEKDHCREAYNLDVRRAKELLEEDFK